MRAVVGEEDAELMRTPAVRVEREPVVVTPDRCFAALLVDWLNSIHQGGLFCARLLLR
jgi:hypothetical protein